MPLRLVTSLETMARLRDDFRRKGVRVGLVPTMGALHEGHGSLVSAARRESDMVVATIFVNPLQFGPSEDFSRYPRDLDGDREKLERWGCDVLFTTSPSAMYPAGFQTYVDPCGPIVSAFEGAARPGHFRGVATVVTKLLNLAGPTTAYFGRKDAQQSALVKRMVADLNIPVRIVVCPTARDTDGLALSSRNVYLSAEQRGAAPGIYKSLCWVRDSVRGGERATSVLRQSLEARLRAIPGGELDYCDLVEPDSFERLGDRVPERFGTIAPVLAIAVVRFGTTRLLDNLRLDEDGD
jgi:pantoate--beta-alanine ligase